MRVLITGTSSGLGKALAKEFTQNNHDVVGTSNEKKLLDWPMINWEALDPRSLTGLVEDLKESVPCLDIVINNVGINAIRKFEDLDSGFIHDILHVNAVAPVLLVKELLANRILSKGAVICNVISDAAWRPMRHSLAYNISKAALDMATKQMARELTKPHDLTIFGVRPGKMNGTGMSRYIDQSVMESRGWSKEQADEYFRNNSVAGRENSPFAVARFIYNACTSGMPISGACMDLAG
jgi:NAD(P)-dependent dehydrogenase (short-subunit alcohol dehydrogenase family)